MIFKKAILYASLQVIVVAAISQNIRYSTSNTHSHNDYEQKIPFWEAYHHGFASIEADIFLVDSNLYVAHDSIELKKKIRLDSEYLKPVLSCLLKNENHPYSDNTKKLQLLIDLKSDPETTLAAFISLLRKYPSLTNNKLLTWVITGNRPKDFLFTSYPHFIGFDGEINKEYSPESLSKILMMSDDFKKYSNWKGVGKISEKDDALLKAAVRKCKRLNKPVRFWDAPDNPVAWAYFMSLNVDYINTDHIQELSDYLKK